MKLDLTQFKNETLDITFLDGREVNINKPSKELLIDISQLDVDSVSELDINKGLEMVQDVVCKILSHNVQGVTYTKEDLLEMCVDFEAQTAILSTYIQFATGSIEQLNVSR